MAMQAAKRANIRLPPEVNRILYIRNLPYKITAEEMYDIFGKYGPIRQIRVGNTPETRGTAYVVYEDIFDAKNACDHLSGFNVCNRYLVVLYYNANRAFQKMDTKKKEEQFKLLKEKYGINTDPPKKKKTLKNSLVVGDPRLSLQRAIQCLAIRKLVRGLSCIECQLIMKYP
uniref:Splicing factor 3B subunit 6 n=2 Tax=Molossus molossus TaxID=27622 RepID=A0A7J8E4P7_MOLMO|nr:splicing factor 3b subunit 6 [Molossus molossus]